MFMLDSKRTSVKGEKDPVVRDSDIQYLALKEGAQMFLENHLLYQKIPFLESSTYNNLPLDVLCFANNDLCTYSCV